MSLIAAALKHMLAAGMAPDAIVRAVEEMEATITPITTKRQSRNARYYEQNKDALRLKASEKRLNGLKASEASELKGASLAPEETSPEPPKEITPKPITKTEIPLRPSAKRACRFPPEMTLDEKIQSEAKRLGLNETEIQQEYEKFRDHHVSKGSVMVDWLAAWRTWCRNAVQYAARQARPPPSAFNGAPREETKAEIVARFAAKNGLSPDGKPTSEQFFDAAHQRIRNAERFG